MNVNFLIWIVIKYKWLNLKELIYYWVLYILFWLEMNNGDIREYYYFIIIWFVVGRC